MIDLLSPFDYEFMLRAFAATSIAAAVCALLSCWIVLIGWSLMGDAVSHAVLPGVVLAYLVGAPFALGALVFGVLAVVLIGGVRSRGRVKEDAAIGIVFTSLFALGLVLISVIPSRTDLNHIVFGNVLGVSAADVATMAALAAIAALMLLARRRELTVFAFDPVHAHTIGLSPRLLSALLLGVLALTTVVALQVVGVILVVAMLIIPGATARLLTARFGRMLWLAPVLSVLCSLVGVYLSYWLDASPGGLVVVVQGTVFAVVFVVTGRRRGGRAYTGAAARTAAGRQPTDSSVDQATSTTRRPSAPSR